MNSEDHRNANAQQEGQLIVELLAMLNRVYDEYDMTTIQIIGCLEKTKSLYLGMSNLMLLEDEEDGDE